jgi:uncharacterized protein YjgD (DUF1641 family)
MILYDTRLKDTEDFKALFLDSIYLNNTPVKEDEIRSKKINIDRIFFDIIRNSLTIEEIKQTFDNYLQFYDTYYQFLSENFALLFLNCVHSDIKTIPENIMNVQKNKIDDLFHERIKCARTVEEINSLFSNYLYFFDSYQKLITEDLATIFLNNIHSDNESPTENKVRQEKENIDSAFFEKISFSRSTDEIEKLFENYLDFFNTYKDFITE